MTPPRDKQQSTVTQQRAGLMVLAIKVNEVDVEAMLGRSELLPEQAEHTREEIVDALERRWPAATAACDPKRRSGGATASGDMLLRSVVAISGDGL